MKITLLGLCGLIAANGILKAGLDRVQRVEQSLPDQVPVSPAGVIPPQDAATVHRSGLSQDEAAARHEWTKRIGSLHLTKRNEPQFEPGENDETVTLRDRPGRTVGHVTGHWVDVEMIRDLTSDGMPELVLRTWSGTPTARSSTTSTPPQRALSACSPTSRAMMKTIARAARTSRCETLTATTGQRS